MKRAGAILLLLSSVAALVLSVALLRITQVTDFIVHSAIKDPVRTPPAGPVIVAPADGTVIYVTRVEGGSVPEMVKRGVAVPLTAHFKTGDTEQFGDGWLVGIYMNGDGVHVNRVPIEGTVRRRIVFNGPHMDMTATESTIMLTGLMPGWISVKKLLGLRPYDIEDSADFILKSARETLILHDVRDRDVYVTRIADFTVGKILTWVKEGEAVVTGQKLGMITWGSQTDIFIPDSAGLEMQAKVGRFVYGGESVLATY